MSEGGKTPGIQLRQ